MIRKTLNYLPINNLSYGLCAHTQRKYTGYDFSYKTPGVWLCTNDIICMVNIVADATIKA